jgi:HD-like signal output (HDOD) protein
MKKTSLNDLRSHLFEVIERLKLSNDPGADEQEKISIETARAIAEVGDVIVRSAKLEVDVIKAISFTQNPQMVKEFLSKTDALLLEEKKDTNPTQSVKI